MNADCTAKKIVAINLYLRARGIEDPDITAKIMLADGGIHHGAARDQIEYRNYHVSPDWCGFGFWEYAHKDYDGPEDNRSGVSRHLMDALLQIDQMEDEA